MKLFNNLSLIVVAPIKYIIQTYVASYPFLSIIVSTIYTFLIPISIAVLATYVSVFVFSFSLLFGIIWFLLFNHGMNLLIDSAKEIDN